MPDFKFLFELSWYFFILLHSYAWGTSAKKYGAHSTRCHEVSLSKVELEVLY